MPVPVMQVGHVRMRMPHRLVHVLVGVGLGPLVAVVRVLVMLVVNMAMGVRQPAMLVFVPM
jgi:predicted membrane protein